MQNNTRNVLITGSSSGIGLAVTNNLLAKGFLVSGISRNKPDIKSKNFTWNYVDLSKDIENQQGINNILKDKYTDVILCAGVSGFNIRGELYLSPFSKEQIININYQNQAKLISLLLNKNISINIYFFSSGQVDITPPLKGAELYVETKNKMIDFLKKLPKQGNISIINPGLVDTPLFHELENAQSEDLRQRYITAVENNLVIQPEKFADMFFEKYFSNPKTP